MAIVDEKHKITHHRMLGISVMHHFNGKLLIVAIDGRIFDIFRFLLT